MYMLGAGRNVSKALGVLANASAMLVKTQHDIVVYIYQCLHSLCLSLLPIHRPQFSTERGNTVNVELHAIPRMITDRDLVLHHGHCNKRRTTPEPNVVVEDSRDRSFEQHPIQPPHCHVLLYMDWQRMFPKIRPPNLLNAGRGSAGVLPTQSRRSDSSKPTFKS